MKEMFKIAHRGRYKHKLRSEFSKTGEKSKKKREIQRKRNDCASVHYAVCR